MLNKPLEYWAVIIGMTVWFFVRIPNSESLVIRVLKTLGAATLGFGLCHDVAVYLGIGDALAAVLVMAFGMIFLDATTSFLSNEKNMAAFLRKRLGLKDEEK